MDTRINAIFTNFLKGKGCDCGHIIIEKDITNRGKDTEKMIFCTNDEIFQLDTSPIHLCKGFFSKLPDGKSNILNQNCDGVLFNKKLNELIFIELKSKLDINDYIKAVKQIEDTIIKTIMYLNIVETFNSHEFTVKGYIVFQSTNINNENRTYYIKKPRGANYIKFIENNINQIDMFASYNRDQIPLKKYGKYRLTPIILNGNTGCYDLSSGIIRHDVCSSDKNSICQIKTA